MTGGAWAKSLGLDRDGDLYVEIEQGIRLYDMCLKDPLPGPTKIRPEDLMRPEWRQLYYRFLSTLKEIELVIINSCYDGGRPFREGDVVVDAGARIGSFALKASALVGKEGRVVAIEPEPRNFARLIKNIEANRIGNVIAVPKALWSEEGRLNLYLSADASGHSVFCDPFYGQTGESVSVEAATLDGILADLGIPAVSFVKMDIEGSEIEALKGMKEVLNAGVQLAIAAYHPVEGGFAHSLIIPQLEKSGFETRLMDGIVYARRSPA